MRSSHRERLYVDGTRGGEVANPKTESPTHSGSDSFQRYQPLESVYLSIACLSNHEQYQLVKSPEVFYSGTAIGQQDKKWHCRDKMMISLPIIGTGTSGHNAPDFASKFCAFAVGRRHPQREDEGVEAPEGE